MQAGASFENAIQLKWVRPKGGAAEMGGAGAGAGLGNGDAGAAQLPSISADQDVAEGGGADPAPRQAVALPYPRRTGRWILLASLEGGWEEGAQSCFNIMPICPLYSLLGCLIEFPMYQCAGSTPSTPYPHFTPSDPGRAHLSCFAIIRVRAAPKGGRGRHGGEPALCDFAV